MIRTLLTVLVAAATIAACGADSSASSPAPSPPAQAITIDGLMADPGPHDGQPVRVTGFFLASGSKASLCGISLESYPPQCGGSTVNVVGEVPQSTLNLLDHTTEPDLAQATWGWVVVTGTFQADTATIELGEIELQEG